MMNNVFDLLKQIEQKPGLYLGTVSITALRMFLVGYKHAQQEMAVMPTEEELDFYRKFQPWLQKRLNVHTANGWDKIVLIQSINEKEAFQSFFKLLKKFQQRNKSQNMDSI